MSERKVPLAYVTKWAATKGILVVKDAKTYKEYLSKGAFLFVRAAEWTEDKATAEKRYQAALRRKVASAKKRVADLETALNSAPKYSEES